MRRPRYRMMVEYAKDDMGGERPTKPLKPPKAPSLQLSIEVEHVPLLEQQKQDDKDAAAAEQANVLAGAD